MCVCKEGEGKLVNTKTLLLLGMKGDNRMSNVGRYGLYGEEEI